MNRRDTILTAAKRLFSQYGPQKTTIADIAREAGVGVGTVYLEFASKEAILEELSTSRHRLVLNAMRSSSEAVDADWAARLSAALTARALGFLCTRDDGLHASDLIHCGNPAVKAAHRWFEDEERRLIQSLLAGGARAGEFDVADPAAVATLVLRAYVTFSPPWVLGRSLEEIERPLAAMHELVLRGLLHRMPRREARPPEPQRGRPGPEAAATAGTGRRSRG
jgi:AcrR family transcriptional regulator